VLAQGGTSVTFIALDGVTPALNPGYNDREHKPMSRRTLHHGQIEAAPPCRLRLILTRPRAGLNLVPSQSRPSLFGGD
jgi:hypothetical protein